MNKEINRLLDAIVEEGCHCDLLYGYFCGIHTLVDTLKKELDKTVEASESEVRSDRR